MKITNLKYNLEFEDSPEGKLFIEKYKELSLDISLLGKYFSFKNELKKQFQNCVGQLIGLTINKKKYYLIFKIINKKFNNHIGYLNCSIKILNINIMPLN